MQMAGDKMGGHPSSPYRVVVVGTYRKFRFLERRSRESRVGHLDMCNRYFRSFVASRTQLLSYV
jgi:hypothetical protein